jgi:hypothetical protein
MSVRSALRRAYDGLALFSVLHLVAVGGILAYAVWSGVLDGPALERVAMALRGALPSEPRAPARGTDGRTNDLRTPEETKSSAKDVSATETPVISSTQELDVYRREAERIRIELDQQLALVNAALLKVTKEREAFHREREALAQKDDEALLARRAEGFKKQVEILEGLAPKVALEHVLGIEDPDEAARLLAAMDPRKVRRVVEAAKSPKDLQRMRAIVQRVQDAAPQSPDALTQAEPRP